ncbi:MAG: ribonuclease [Patescibacteria group bacterium]|nr:ribonuclease [Patescibacteria group bacterium]
MKNESSFEHERELFDSGYDFVIGIDEAGRGPLAGPVVACACTLRTSDVLRQEDTLSRHPMSQLIRDSKTLSEKQRESLYDFIFENFYVGVGICDHRTIDRINILEATYLAMKSAVSQLRSKIKRQNAKLQCKIQDFNTRYQIPDTKYIILVDGNKSIPNLSIEQRAIVNGDKIVKSISAASIVAKVTRDRIMREFHEKYPEYCFDKHKGYGTAAHMAKIREFGSCEIHRKSFEPIRSLIKSKCKNQK